MKILIDTNVLLSAILRDKDPETVILWIAAQDDWQWIVSQQIIDEYKSVLARPKFGLPQETLLRWYSLLDQVTVLEEVNLSIDFKRDPKDAIFLSCATAVQAGYLITGDKDFTKAERLFNTIILSVSMFKRLIIDSPTAP